MRNDVIELLRDRNPVPIEPPAIPIERVLAQLDKTARLAAEDPHKPPMRALRRERSAPGRAHKLAAGLPVALSIIVALSVAAVLLIATGHQHATSSSGKVAASSPHLPPLAQQLAVFRRPQTAKDRSLPAVLRKAERLAGLNGPLARSMLDNVIPSLTRYIETLPGDREVFLAVYSGPRHQPPGRPGRTALDGITLLGLVIVQPDGKWTDGQPVLGGYGGANLGALQLEASSGPSGCDLDTYSNIVPNNVTQIRWQYPRQDAYGYVYKAPLTVTVPVHSNVAVATVPERASCDRPSVVTVYGADGHVLSRRGSAANLDRISRPIRHGNPFAGRQSLQHRP
jgi:hypothetical protein